MGVTPTGLAAKGEDMTEQQCPCCGAEQSTDEPGASGGDERWLGEARLDATLPEELQAAFGQFFGTGPVETLDACADRFREQNGTIAVDDLCATDEQTAHRATVDGEQYRFLCFYDAVILATLESETVDIRTESPDGAVVEARAVGGDELTVTPDTAVFSFGLDPAAGGDGDPTLEDGYAAICPYVNAFPDRDAYESWATAISAPTVGLPLAGATAFAAALTE